MIASWQESSDKPGPCVESRDITLPKKVLGPWPSQSYGLASDHLQLWELDCKKAEHQKIDAFEQWCWRRLLSVPWMARRSNQSILRKSTLNTHWKNWCWSWNSSILVPWWEQPTHWKSPWFWEWLRTEGEEGIRGWWLNGITDAMDMNLGKLQEDGEGQGGLVCCSPWSCRVKHDWEAEQQQQKP